MTENILKYPDIEWSLPLLFYSDYIYGAICNAFKAANMPAPKANIFGTPSCLWSGGRRPSCYEEFQRHKFAKLLKYITFSGGIPSFTFTSVGLTKDDIKDPYCNMLLDVALEENARFIVFDDRLRDHIKSKKADAIVVASIIKPIFEFQDFSKKKEYLVEEETAYYNKLLKEYDVAVVRPEYSKYALVQNPSIIDDISRIEVLINQQCTLNCPRAVAHYSSFEEMKNDKGKKVPFQCYRAIVPAVKHYDYDINSFHDEQSLQKLTSAGVKRLKVQGRSLPLTPAEVYLNTINHIVKYAGSGYIFFEHIVPRINDELNFYRRFIA